MSLETGLDCYIHNINRQETEYTENMKMNTVSKKQHIIYRYMHIADSITVRIVLGLTF